MKLNKLVFLAAMTLTVVAAQPVVAAEAGHVPVGAQSTLVLTLHSNTEKPGAKLADGQFLIVNKARYYNVVDAVFTANKKFLWFQGWDNGEMTVFKPKDYQYWSPLPTK